MVGAGDAVGVDFVDSAAGVSEDDEVFPYSNFLEVFLLFLSPGESEIALK